MCLRFRVFVVYICRRFLVHAFGFMRVRAHTSHTKRQLSRFMFSFVVVSLVPLSTQFWAPSPHSSPTMLCLSAIDSFNWPRHQSR